MIHMGMQFSEEEVDEMIKDIDADGDGEIDYEEVCPVSSCSNEIFSVREDVHFEQCLGRPLTVVCPLSHR